LGRDVECEKKGYVSIAINGYTLGHKYRTPHPFFIENEQSWKVVVTKEGELEQQA
jgi:hypothetical protein